MKVHLVHRSDNKKTGPIPVSTTSMDSCPPTCGMYDTCYAKFGPISMHWRKVGERGTTWDAFITKIKMMPKGQLWRHNQAGDLPGDGAHIDAWKLGQLVDANKGKRGFTYTHYPLNDHNIRCLQIANGAGFTINVSRETREQVDAARALGLPAVMVLPSDVKWKRRGDVLVCPAYWKEHTTCATCGICQEGRANRVVVGFPAHGTKKRVIDIQLKREK